MAKRLPNVSLCGACLVDAKTAVVKESLNDCGLDWTVIFALDVPYASWVPAGDQGVEVC